MSRQVREQLERAQAELKALAEPLDEKALLADLQHREAALDAMERRLTTEYQQRSSATTRLERASARARQRRLLVLLRNLSAHPGPHGALGLLAGVATIIALDRVVPFLPGHLELPWILLGPLGVLVLPLLLLVDSDL